MMARTGLLTIISVFLQIAFFPVPSDAEKHVFAVLSDISSDELSMTSLECCIRDINQSEVSLVIVTGCFPEVSGRRESVLEQLDKLHCEYFICNGNDDEKTSHIFNDDIWDVYFDFCGTVAIDCRDSRMLSFCGCSDRNRSLRYFSGVPLLLCRPLVSPEKQSGYTLIMTDGTYMAFSEKIVFSSTVSELPPWFEASF